MARVPTVTQELEAFMGRVSGVGVRGLHSTGTQVWSKGEKIGEWVGTRYVVLPDVSGCGRTIMKHQRTLVDMCTGRRVEVRYTK